MVEKIQALASMLVLGFVLGLLFERWVSNRQKRAIKQTEKSLKPSSIHPGIRGWPARTPEEVEELESLVKCPSERLRRQGQSAYCRTRCRHCDEIIEQKKRDQRLREFVASVERFGDKVERGEISYRP